MRCTRCHGAIQSCELVPRTLGVRGTIADPEIDAELGDETWWEGSATVGYGCVTEMCPNWSGNFGVILPPEEGSTVYGVLPGLELSAFAEDVEPDQ